jgi:hypothetical protein
MRAHLLTAMTNNLIIILSSSSPCKNSVWDVCTYTFVVWKPQEEEEEVVIYMTAHAGVEKSSFLFRPLFHYTFFRWPCCCLFYLFLYFFICICLGRLLGLPRDVASPSFAHHLLCPTAAAAAHGEVRNPTAKKYESVIGRS